MTSVAATGSPRTASLVAVVEHWTSGRRALLTGSAIMLVLAVGFFNPIFRSNATFSDVAGHQTAIWPWTATPTGFTDTYPQSDEADSVYPWIVFSERAFRSGTIALWNPDSLGGTPFLTNGLGVALYPPRVLMQLLVPPSWVHDLLMMLQVFLSGVAMFALLRAFATGFLGSLLAGVAWMFASFNFAWIQLEIVGAFAVFLPLGLLCAFYANQRRSWWWASAAGLSLGFAALGSSLQLAGPLVFAVAIYAACLGLREIWQVWPDRRAAASALGRPALMGIVAGCISAPITLPSLILSRQIGRQPIPLDFIRTQSVHWRTFVENSFVAPSLPTTALTMNFQAVWVGGAVAVFAVFAVVALPLRRTGASLGRVLTLATALVLGGTIVAFIPYHLVPGFSFLTALGRMADFWCFGVALLGGLGLDRALQLSHRLGERAGPSRAMVIRAASAAIAIVVILFTAYQTMSYARSINPPFQPRTSADLYPATPAIRAIQRDAAARPATEPQRILPLRIANPSMYASHAMVFGIESAAGYESLAVSRTIDFWRVVSGEKPAAVIASPLQNAFIANYYPATTRFDLLARAGVTTLLTPPDVANDPSWRKRHATPLTIRPIYSGPDGRVMDVTQAVPRAFVVHRADVVETPAAALARYATPAFSYRRTVVLERSDGALASRRGSGAPTIATALHRGLNGATWQVKSSTPGYLVLLDSWAPGWSVSVNGHSARVLHANYAFRAVEVPAGTSAVKLVYRPGGFIAGLWLATATIVGFVLAAGALLYRRRRQAPPGG
jgi:hypothetical protein